MTEPSPFIRALTEAIIPVEDLRLDDDDRRQAIEEAATFVQAEMDALPRRLAIMFNLGMFVFRLSVRMAHLKAFCSLSLPERRETVERWAYGPVSLFRALFKPVRSTAFIAFFESTAVLNALDDASERASGSREPVS